MHTTSSHGNLFETSMILLLWYLPQEMTLTLCNLEGQNFFNPFKVKPMPGSRSIPVVKVKIIQLPSHGNLFETSMIFLLWYIYHRK
jgi:hypothetical protein